MLYARLLDSPHPSARVRSIDLSAAEKLPGVRAALALKGPDNPATSKVMYQGEEVAAVAAVSEEVAQDAIRLIKVDYEVLPHLATVEQAMRPEAPLVFEKGNTREPTLQQDGDLEAGFKAAAHIVEGLYSTQVQTHTSLETHGGICEWNGENLTAWVSTQAVHATREGTARALNIPQTNVRVITDYMGGGFGSKLGGDVQVVICARLAKMANAPVKLMLDRKEEHLVTGNRPSAFAKIRAAVDANGKLLGHRCGNVGHRRRRTGFEFPGALSGVCVLQPPAAAQGRVHQRRSAAGVPRAGPSAVLFRHGDRDGRTGGSAAARSAGAQAAKPAARGRERAVGALLQDGRGADRLEQASSDRRSGSGSDQARHGLRGQPVGGERHQPLARGLSDPPRRRRRHAGGDAGHRHRNPNARGDRDRRDDGPADRVGSRGDRRHQLSVGARQRRQRHGAVGHVDRSRGRRTPRCSSCLPRSRLR